jgi:hypothetical protein
MKRTKNRTRAELNAARRRWGPMERERMRELRTLVETHKLSILLGEVLLLDNRWYVTHAGLLRYAHRHRCSGIETNIERRLSDPAANRWVCRAVVYGSNELKAFVGYGDADPFNVSAAVRGAEMRIAETRAVNRALRKAYGIGLCSVEELGEFSSRSPAREELPSPNGDGRTQPRLRDQLCLVIRHFKLDPNLVKSYAADFCGTATIGEAGRDSVEAFLTHLRKSAEENRDALICKLNSYAVRAEVAT